MNSEQADDLIAYRIGRSKETFEEALMMRRAGHWNTCANRLYYAAFYAVSALLARHGFSSSKHTGVKSLFNQYFVKTGKMDKDAGRLSNRLFDARQEGDYMDFVYFDKNTVEPLIGQTEIFLNSICKIISDT